MLLLLIQKENLTKNKGTDAATGGRECANSTQQWQSASGEARESKCASVGDVLQLL